MENYLMINGKKILLTEEQVRILSENSPFDRQPENGRYYFISNTGIATTRDLGAYNDAKNFENANYCSNKELVIRREFYERVERNLWRFSMENGGSGAFRIELDILNDNWSISCDHSSNFEVGFKTAEVAKRAIKEVLEPMLRKNHKTSADLFEWRF